MSRATLSDSFIASLVLNQYDIIKLFPQKWRDHVSITQTQPCHTGGDDLRRGPNLDLRVSVCSRIFACSAGQQDPQPHPLRNPERFFLCLAHKELMAGVSSSMTLTLTVTGILLAIVLVPGYLGTRIKVSWCLDQGT